MGEAEMTAEEHVQRILTEKTAEARECGARSVMVLIVGRDNVARYSEFGMDGLVAVDLEGEPCVGGVQ